jgi:hypothetical protein
MRLTILAAVSAAVGPCMLWRYARAISDDKIRLALFYEQYVDL